MIQIDENLKIPCPICGGRFKKADMLFSFDCHGIPLRLVCYDCFEDIMYGEPGYDGCYYSDQEECLDECY